MQERISDTKVMVLGIVSAALCTESWVSIAGLVLSVITLNLVRRYEEENDGILTGKAKAGKICARIAFIVSIVVLVLTVLTTLFGCTAQVISALFN